MRLAIALGLFAVFVSSARAADRVSAARARQTEAISKALSAALLRNPPERLLLRAFKSEGELEIWAGPRRGPVARVWTVLICASSGTLGPKVESGDGQVPEGIYRVTRFNPWSNFHLSLGLDYPNAVDRVRSGTKATGGDIFIHGNCVTIGCIPIGDDAIERVYLLASDVHARGGTVEVHVFPSRMDEARWTWLRKQVKSGDPRLELWSELRAIDAAFAVKHEPPTVRTEGGHYRLTGGHGEAQEKRAGKGSALR